MARLTIAIFLGAASLVLILVFQLTARLDYSSVGGSWYASSLNAISGSGFSLTSFRLNEGSLKADEYLLGVGKADITGPIVEINLMGYADPKQLGTGVRQRLYSRSFIIGDINNPSDRFVYLILDTQSGDTAIRHGILEGLKQLGREYSVYRKDNIAVTGTHSHSGPGAWLNYLLPQITSKGFDNQSYQAIVDGAILSIVRAHESLEPGVLDFGSTEIEDANINRSLFAYLANPEEERNKYKNNVDKTMTMLKFQRKRDGKDIGMLNWFPVHGTSMLGNNTLITGDNKGVAAYLFEQYIKHERSDPRDPFVAGFSQSNVGDTSPNVLGAYCEEGPSNGQECRLEDSTCDGRNEPCHGRGPFYGLNDSGARSCFEIGRRQFKGAQALFTSLQSKSSKESATTISGSVGAFHTYRDLSNYTFVLPNGTQVSTCAAALGYSFAAGTSDGPGAFDFKQNNSGDPNASPLWGAVRNFLHRPSAAQQACHAPKPILLDVGESKSPYLWSPNIVDIQLLRVGQLIIIVSPGEASTMAGRYWKAAIAAAATPGLVGSHSDKALLVVLGGPANTYTHYITTAAEYAVQRYEGASTLYGPHTLAAYINLTTTLLPHLFPSPSDPRTLDPGPSPPIHTNKSLSFITPVIADSPGLFKSFGALLTDVSPPATRIYKPGTDIVRAVFIAANPRNALRLEDSYAAVVWVGPAAPAAAPAATALASPADAGDLVRDVPPPAPAPPRTSAAQAPAPHTVLTDADWALTFEWRRTSTVLGTSEATLAWEIDAAAAPGLYRLRYRGDAKGLGGRVEAFEGWSSVFEVR